jgi:hypothetical protein
MWRHLAACPAGAGAKKPGKGKAPAGEDGERADDTDLLTLFVDQEGSPDYWLHVEVPASAPLGALDDFLREIWLECCGHMSAFRVGRETFAGEDGDFGLPASTLFAGSPRDVGYVYDWGSSTRLRIQRVGASRGPDRGVRLLARNVAPAHECDECDRPATKVCPECMVEEDSGWLCDEHAESHPCEDGVGLLPALNSPRVGVCAYGAG